MSNLEKRIAIKAESKKRIGAMSFGDAVTNICAGEKNPWLQCFFVRYRGSDHMVQVTTGKGVFGWFGADVIHAGTIDAEKRAELFAPVWDSLYGES